MSYPPEVITSQQQVSITSYTVTNSTESWSSNVCDCCDDMGICLCGTFVPCILSCRVAEDYGECCLLPCLPGTMLAMRTGMREKYHIQGSICDDWVVMFCLPLCGLCQMAREQKRH
ncbi:cornifelin homolog [Acipenser ruthenus]|uniref:cornifelin homolog n=1 Tax=Acipenser ruthenus TaxID=7906 RepID=UPI002741AA37|nr:cornifelin homolog [Acipenser ruthenus]